MFVQKLRQVLPFMSAIPARRIHPSLVLLQDESSDSKKGPGKTENEPSVEKLLDDSASFHEYVDGSPTAAFNPYPKEAKRYAKAKKRDQSSYSVRPPVDPSLTSIFLFPGQGTQFVGMGQNLLECPSAKEIFMAANEILKYDLLPICLEGPKTELDRTVHAQPAIYVSSLAALEVVREREPEAIESCMATAGFSLGELTALTFAGALSFEDGLKLVQVRAEAMQYASDLIDSAMMSVFYGPDSKLSYALLLAKEWCIKKGIQNPECCVSNYLYPGCKIIAGHEEALRFIEKNAADFKLRKLKRLAVSGAFHTRLMQDAVSPFASALQRVSVHDPLIRVHSNVDGKAYRDANHIKKQLPKQILAPVKWEQTLHILYERPSALSFPKTYECGPGNSLKSILDKVNLKAGSKCKVIRV